MVLLRARESSRGSRRGESARALGSTRHITLSTLFSAFPEHKQQTHAMRIEPGTVCPPAKFPRAAPRASGGAGSSSSHRSCSDDIRDDEAHNSEDEEGGYGAPQMDMAAAAAAESRFLQRLTARGLEIKHMATDGNCLFRSVADRVYGDAEMHDVVRRLCIEHIDQSREHFSQYITEDFNAYVQRKRRDGVYGNHVEIQAISEMYNRPVHVYDVHGSADEPMNAFATSTEGEPGAPLRLSYHGRASPACPPERAHASWLLHHRQLLSIALAFFAFPLLGVVAPRRPSMREGPFAHALPTSKCSCTGSHYNVIFDPACADAGVGLGLPGLEPGGADRMQLEAAAQASEESALEAQLLCEVRSWRNAYAFALRILRILRIGPSGPAALPRPREPLLSAPPTVVRLRRCRAHRNVRRQSTRRRCCRQRCATP